MQKRRQVPHRKREAFHGRACMVTVHLVDGLRGLREQKALGVVHRALAKAKERFGCRVIQFSVLGNHAHFLLEAPDEKALGRAMKGLLVRLARGLNRLWGRKGQVFEKRFHSAVLTTMRQVHRALRYVLLNARKHGIFVPAGQPDPYSSGPWFKHWRERLWRPFRSDEAPVVEPAGLTLIELVYMRLPVGLDDLPGTPLGF